MAARRVRTRGTIMIELLALVRRRVPLSETDVAAAAGVDEGTLAAWVEHRATPSEARVLRIGQLITAIERLEVTTKPNVIADWLTAQSRMLDGRRPLAMIVADGYERVAAIVEDFIYPTFT